MSNFKVIRNNHNFPYSLHKQYKLALLLELKLLENIQNIIYTFPDALCLIPFHTINSILFNQNILTQEIGKFFFNCHLNNRCSKIDRLLIISITTNHTI